MKASHHHRMIFQYLPLCLTALALILAFMLPADAAEIGGEVAPRAFSPADLAGITRAKLVYHTTPVQREMGYDELYEFDVIDEETLKAIEDVLTDAEDLGGMVAGCPFDFATLELTLADGRSVTLSLAVDSCRVYRVDDRDYNYAQSRWTPELGLTNRVLFDLFDGAPASP